MALVNEIKREINAKIVYVGPAGAGKTTHLQYIYRKLKPEFRSPMKSMPLQENRMLYFDFMPPGQGGAGGYNVRFHIYTLAGDALSSAAWRILLKGVDGIVFVADSQAERSSENQECLALIREQLGHYRQELGVVPWLLLCNKQDLVDSLHPAEIQAAMHAEAVASFPTVAAKGEGVLEGLYQLIKSILGNLRAQGFAAESETEELREAPVPPPVPEPLPAESQAESVCEAAEADIETGADSIQLSIDGPPRVDADGRLAVPLLIQAGSAQKRVELAISLSISG
jgi:signal recognition particle receptor subunit beta